MKKFGFIILLSLLFPLYAVDGYVYMGLGSVYQTEMSKIDLEYKTNTRSLKQTITVPNSFSAMSLDSIYGLTGSSSRIGAGVFAILYGNLSSNLIGTTLGLGPTFRIPLATTETFLIPLFNVQADAAFGELVTTAALQLGGGVCVLLIKTPKGLSGALKILYFPYNNSEIIIENYGTIERDPFTCGRLNIGVSIGFGRV